MSLRAAKLQDFIEADPLYDIALEEVVPCVPAEIQAADRVFSRMMIELMCVCWMRGVWWQAERGKEKACS